MDSKKQPKESEYGRGFMDLLKKATSMHLFHKHDKAQILLLDTKPLHFSPAVYNTAERYDHNNE